MNILTYISTLLCLTFLLFSCDRTGLCKDDKLTIERTDYDRDQLRIDGYFFGDIDSNSSNPFAYIYYFYRNGVFFTSDAEELSEAQAGTFSIDTDNSFGKRIKSSWGVFKIDGNAIEIDRWYPSINGCEITVYEQGEIRNDTTFVITRREYRSNGKVESAATPNSSFYFRALPQKPDSINDFIK